MMFIDVWQCVEHKSVRSAPSSRLDNYVTFSAACVLIIGLDFQNRFRFPNHSPNQDASSSLSSLYRQQVGIGADWVQLSQIVLVGPVSRAKK